MRTTTVQKNTMALAQNDFNRRIFFTIFSLFLVVGGLYLYFLGNIVFSVLERKTVESQTKVVAEAVNELEIQYLAKDNGINLSLAESLGFNEAKSALFASRANAGASVSLR